MDSGDRLGLCGISAVSHEAHEGFQNEYIPHTKMYRACEGTSLLQSLGFERYAHV